MLLNVGNSRSEEEITGEVLNSIRKLGYPQLDAVKCTVVGATVTLSGKLGSFYLAAIAQNVAAAVRGVHRVCNQVEVVQKDTGLAVADY